MKKLLSKISKKLSGGDDYLEGEEYVDIKKEDEKKKIAIKIFNVSKFSDTKLIIDNLRDGYVIALIDVKILKDKDIFELKRVINSLKKTCDAIGGDVAGLSEDWVVATPGFAEIYRKEVKKVK